MTTERPIYPLVIPAVAQVFEVLRIPAALYYRVPWRVNPWSRASRASDMP